jgi:hypothetical protein
MLELRHERLHRALTELADGAMLRRRVDLIWSNRRIGFAVAVAVAALSGLAIAVAMPRGPVTAAQALVLMGSGLATGLAGRMAA